MNAETGAFVVVEEATIGAVADEEAAAATEHSMIAEEALGAAEIGRVHVHPRGVPRTVATATDMYPKIMGVAIAVDPPLLVRVAHALVPVLAAMMVIAAADLVGPVAHHVAEALRGGRPLDTETVASVLDREAGTITNRVMCGAETRRRPRVARTRTLVVVRDHPRGADIQAP